MYRYTAATYTIVNKDGRADPKQAAVSNVGTRTAEPIHPVFAKQPHVVAYTRL